MNTLELLSSLEGCKIVKREDGVIEIIPEVEVKEAPKFKDGDFVVYVDNWGDKSISIFHKIDYDGDVVIHCRLKANFLSIDWIREFYKGMIPSIRLADESEKQLLLDALRKERKIWNQETLQIEEDKYPRIGDKCVFWNEGYMDVVVSNLYDLDVEASQYNTDESGPYENCVRLQDFNFETMAPKHEK